MLGFNQYSKYSNNAGISIKGYFLKYKSDEEEPESEDISDFSEPKDKLPF